MPATSANLGSGFDVLGIALNLRNIFIVSPARETTLEIRGYSEGVPNDGSNLFYRAFCHLYHIAGREAPGVNIEMDLQVPPGMGLGSSATAVVGGLVAANAYLGDLFGEIELLTEAIKLEHGGHADNVAPALLGGLVINVLDGTEVVPLRVNVGDELKAIVFTPDFSMDTVQGRALMPDRYSKADVVFSTGRVALFIAALGTRQYGLLRIALQDRLHQPYRAQIFPLLPDLVAAAIGAGAHGACLSGGGSSVLALATEHLVEIGEAMMRKSKATSISGEIRILGIDQEGTQATWEERRGE